MESPKTPPTAPPKAPVQEIAPGKALAKRDEKGGWLKGQSGNPGGRPKGLERQVRETVDFTKVTAFLADIVYGERAAGTRTADRIKAAELLYDRGYGKARQAIDLAAEISSSDAPTGRVSLDALDDTALALLERVLEERLAGSVEVGPDASRALKP